MTNDDWPHDDHFLKDNQQHKLYHWENAYLLPYTSHVSEKKARQIIKQVCQDYDIKPVKLKWRAKEGGSSYYSHEDHSITFRHRDLVSLLHEIGHAIHAKNDENEKGAHHSPAFARIAIALYHRYAGFKLDYLIVSANSQKLLGDLTTEQVIFDPQEHPQA